MTTFFHALSQIRFAQMDFFPLCGVVLLFMYFRLRTGRVAALPYSDISLIKKIRSHQPESRQRVGMDFLRWIRSLALLLIVLALARPQYVHIVREKETGKNDIFLVLDFSKSMFREQITTPEGKMSRFEAMQRVVDYFLNKRKGDRIGVVGFERYPSLVCPLTKDYSWVQYALRDIQESASYTAIGSGIAYACNLLRESRNPNKIIIVATDGKNNAGISLHSAAKVAQHLNIRVYTVEMGVPTESGSIKSAKNELRQVAEMTRGKFYRALDGSELRAIYDEINSSEKNTQERLTKTYYEAFSWFLIPALALLFIELALAQTFFMKLP
ncbi:MAG: VWA domain-containing protein [Verrucomicrobiota bacterium]